MKNKCKDCGICCLDTEMIVSIQDIDHIMNFFSNNIKKEDFVCEINGNLQLNNINGHCVFFDLATKRCKIYNNRPQGCRFYPLIYDKYIKNCIYDKECPRTDLFYRTKNEFQENCEALRNFLRECLNFDV
jgi:hypothetical protein